MTVFEVMAIYTWGCFVGGGVMFCFGFLVGARGRLRGGRPGPAAPGLAVVRDDTPARIHRQQGGER